MIVFCFYILELFFECKLKLSHRFLLLLLWLSLLFCFFFKTILEIYSWKQYLNWNIYLNWSAQLRSMLTFPNRHNKTKDCCYLVTSYFQVPWFSGYCSKLLRFALIMLNPQLVQTWKLIVVFSHHILPSAIFPSGRFLLTCYFLGVERDISFPYQLEISQFTYCMTSLHHFTLSSWADEVINL